MDAKVKVREDRVRRAAYRRGYRLTKSRRRDVRALGFGRFTLVENGGVFRVFRDITIDEAERILDEVKHPYEVQGRDCRAVD